MLSVGEHNFSLITVEGRAQAEEFFLFLRLWNEHIFYIDCWTWPEMRAHTRMLFGCQASIACIYATYRIGGDKSAEDSVHKSLLLSNYWVNVHEDQFTIHWKWNKDVAMYVRQKKEGRGSEEDNRKREDKQAMKWTWYILFNIIIFHFVNLINLLRKDSLAPHMMRVAVYVELYNSDKNGEKKRKSFHSSSHFDSIPRNHLLSALMRWADWIWVANLFDAISTSLSFQDII